MTSKTPASTNGAVKQEIALHILFSGGGDSTPDSLYNEYHEKPGHFGFSASGLLNAMKIIRDVFQGAHNEVVIKDLELLCHGSSWRKNKFGEVVITPPMMWVGDHMMNYDELRSLRASLDLVETFRYVKTLLITSCNMGVYSQEYFNFRARLAQLLIPAFSNRATEPYSVEVRSSDSYIGNWRNPQRGKPETPSNAEAVPKRVPLYGKFKVNEKSGAITYGSGVMVEHYYKDCGKLIIDWEKSDVLPTLHASLGWG